MTTIGSSQGPTEVINAKRTESRDAPAIHALTSQHTIEQFGNVNVVHLIEKANLAVTLINEENEVLGFAGFLDYPQIEVCDSSKWEEWMNEASYSAVEKATPLNSLFLHHFVAKSDYTIGCASEIVRTVFNAVPDLHFLFLVLRKNIQLEQAISQMFYPVEGGRDGDSHILYACFRHSHVPVLHIRGAVVEDNDDLIPIFTRLNDRLTQTYGDHFLAEMIEAQDVDNHALVAEVGGKAIGFISMCSHVNIDLLQKEYELTAFHGLRKPHADDTLEEDIQTSPVTEDQSVESPSLVTHNEKNVDDIKSSETSMSSPTLEKKDDEVKEDIPAFNELYEPEKSTPFEPTYCGESNCFSIQLFCIDERYEMRSADFLPQVFKLYPNKDFAVITVPHLVPEFPLLQNFVRATPRNNMLVTQELYIFHRAGLLADFKVRPAITEDVEQIITLVKDIAAKDDLLNDIKTFNSARRDEDGIELQAFVAESSKQIVGVAVVRREEDIEYIRSHYNIENFIYFNHHRRDEHGHLHHFAMNPVFQLYTKQFFKEILRQGHKSCLFYPVYNDNSRSEKEHSILTGINYLVPVKSRNQIVYPLDVLKENAPSERVVKDMPNYALYHINRKLTLEPKVTINARIVVIGASSVGISFLETLSFFPHLRFNNLILVSKDGLPNKITSAAYSYTQDQLECMSLKTWVNVVQGVMVAIDRAHKYVILEEGEKVAYDYLMLCCGQQYQIPQPTKADIENGATNYNISPRSIETPYLRHVPNNAISINTASEENQMIKHITGLNEYRGKIVIYGNSLEVYFTLQSLLSNGVPGENIALLIPPTSHKFSEPDTFQEPEIVRQVSSAIKAAGAQVFTECVLAEWELDELDSNKIKSVIFTTPTKPVHLHCYLFLSFYPKCIDAWTFKAVNDACLVFDGRLVINSNFCTNDSCIRSAGTLTKYARRYHAEDWSNHDGYNSCEIGLQLALSVLPLFDPTLDMLPEEEENPNDPYSKLTPVFSDCKVFHGILPGNLEYLHVRKPGTTQAYESQLSNPNHGSEIVTGSVETGNYFRLHINEFNFVQTITCVVFVGGGFSLPVSNIIKLYNIHERYLNNLVARVDEGLVSDLFDFFREPWSMAIFHDRFGDLKQEVRDILCLPPSGNNLSSLEDTVRQLVEEDIHIDKHQRADLCEYYKSIGLKKAVEKRLLSFLNYNYYHLPMYAKPGMV